MSVSYAGKSQFNDLFPGALRWHRFSWTAASMLPENLLFFLIASNLCCAFLTCGVVSDLVASHCAMHLDVD